MALTGKLTALRVGREKRPGMYGDGGGLYLQVTRGGTKFWIFRYWVVARDPATGEPLRNESAKRQAGLERAILLKFRDAATAALSRREMVPTSSIFRAISIVCLMTVASATAAEARSRSTPEPGKCFGILHQDQFGLHFGGSRGEGEGICVIRKSDQDRVLAICRVGRYCEVTGTIRECRGSGECGEMNDIKRIKSSR